MDNGEIGVTSLSVVSPAEKGIKLEPDSATIQHLLMEELIAPDQILIQLLAILRNAQLVTSITLMVYFLYLRNRPLNYPRTISKHFQKCLQILKTKKACRKTQIFYFLLFKS